MNMLEGPSKSQLQNIRKELGEDPDRMQHTLQVLRAWILDQPHLPKSYDNNLLSVFLRGCKHNLERAKRKIEMYFITRARVPELFLDRDPTEDTLQYVTKMIKITPLPKLTPDGYRVTISKIIFMEDIEWDMKDVLRYVYMTADIRVTEEVPIAGDIFIYDLEHFKASHLLKYVTPILKKALISAQEAYPQRLKELHFVNAQPVVDKVITVTKALLNEKMRKRFIIHKNTEDLLHYFPSDILPVDYCGTGEAFDGLVENWSNCIVQHRTWFRLQDTIKAEGYSEQKHIMDKYDSINGISVSGSFRKLEID